MTTNSTPTAQEILDTISALSTPEIEEILDTLNTDFATTEDPEATRLVRMLAIEALEIRDPAHPIVVAAIAAYNAEWEALS